MGICPTVVGNNVPGRIVCPITASQSCLLSFSCLNMISCFMKGFPGLDIATNTFAFATYLYLFATRKTRVVANLRLGFKRKITLLLVNERHNLFKALRHTKVNLSLEKLQIAL